MKRFVFPLLTVLLAGMAQAQEPPVTAPDAPLATPADTPVQPQVVAPVVLPDPPAQMEAPAPTPAVDANPVAPLAPVREPLPMDWTAPPRPLTPAGRWSGDVNAALTASFGNTSGQSLNLGIDAVYQRPHDKLGLWGQYLESRARSVSNGVVATSLTALQWRLGGRYDRDVTPSEFGFMGLDFSQDQIGMLALRSVISAGVGRHLVKTPDEQWDVFGGLTYREDLYYPPGVEIDNVRQTRFDTVESLLGEESSHKLTDTAHLKQKFVLYPGLGNGNGMRATFDAGLQVDINRTLSLNVKLQGRYDSLAEAPAEKYDVLFMTGLSIRFGR